MRRILATDFGLFPTFGNAHVPADRLVTEPSSRAQLANYLLLYDQIVIPTGNLQILPVLRLVLGEAIFDEAIRDRAIVLARYNEWFGYVGNGGLVFFQSGEGPNNPNKHANLAHSYFKPLDRAIDIALVATNPPSSETRRAQIRSLLIDNIVELPTREVLLEAKQEAYADITNSPYLREFMEVRNSSLDLDNIKGARPDKFTIFNPHFPRGAGELPEVRTVLRVAFENFLLSVGGRTGVDELAGDKSTLSVLAAKGQRLKMPTQGNDAFAQIQRVSGVPDLGQAFAEKRLTSEQIWELRNTKHAQVMRDWFASGAPGETAEETLGRFLETVSRGSPIDGVGAKSLRFGVTTTWGAVEPISGAIAAAGDTFLLNKWFPEKSPRLFLKQAKVMLASSEIKAPIMKGRDRNAPCHCGSGKKFKKCHGRN